MGRGSAENPPGVNITFQRGKRLTIAVGAAGIATIVVVGFAFKDLLLEEYYIGKLEAKDDGERKLAASRLGRMRSARAVSALARVLLEDPSEEVRWEARGSLGRIGAAAREAIPAFLRAVADEKLVLTIHWGPTENDEALAAMAEGDATPLVQAIRHENADVRLVAAKALGVLRAESAAVVSDLAGLLGDDDEYVRGAAAWALTQCGKAGLSQLMKVLKRTDQEPALGHIYAAIALKHLGDEAAQEVLGLLDDANPAVRRTAAGALDAMGLIARPAVAKLIQLLQSDASAAVRAQAAAAMVSVGAREGSAVEALRGALEDPAEEVTTAAAAALGEMGPAARDAVPDLVACLKQKTLMVAAARALGEIGPDAVAAVPHLLALLEASWRSETGKALVLLKALEGIGTAAKAAVPLVMEILEHGHDQRLPRSAVDTLGAIGPGASAAVTRIAPRLEAESQGDRTDAAQALGDIGDPSAVPFLAEAYRRSQADAYTRQFIVTALAKIGPAAAPVLEEVCSDVDKTVQRMAADALAKIHGEAADASKAR